MRLNISALVPHANIEDANLNGFRWLGTNSAPQFLIENMADFAGLWVMLKAEISFDGEIASPFCIYCDNGSGCSEDAAIKLYPDADGFIRFVWKAAPTLRAMRINPIAQAGHFTIRAFSMKTVSTPELFLSSALRVLRAYPGGIKHKLAAARRLWRTGGWRAVARRIVYAHNQISHTAYAERGYGSKTTTQLARQRQEHPERLQLLERYVADGFQRSNSKVTWSSRYVPKVSDSLDPDQLPIKVIAFYLPQFHPIPENDAWWGKGFTEWTNVSKAQPQFLGHYQPHLPGELGFYDLRLPEIMRQQIELARKYGISGFCFHHYWFGGKRLLELPLNNFLADPSLNINFCLCWANENWSRRWDGLDSDILMAQNHSPEDDIAFIESLAPAFADPRYIRIDDKPLLIVYHAKLLPDAAATASRWRKRAQEMGFKDLYLVVAHTFDIINPRPFGFDAAVEFPPLQVNASEISAWSEIINPNYCGKIYDYAELAGRYGELTETEFVNFKTVMPSWDNEARKPGAGHSFVGALPEVYARWLSAAVRTTLRHRTEERLLFINAWNEWAEGAHLEPDRHYGYAYLHATANVLRNLTRNKVTQRISELNEGFTKRFDVAVILHLYYEDLIDPIFSSYLSPLRETVDLFVTVKPDISVMVLEKIKQCFPNCYFIVVENRGRDIRPFLCAYRQAHKMGYTYACKVHSKKSPHRSDGEAWRENLMVALLRSPETVESVVRKFASNEALSLLAPHHALCDLSEADVHMGNMKWLDLLLARLDARNQIGKYKFDFPAGSMYWFRISALLPLLDESVISMDEFELEAGQLDGTLAHAIERIVGLVAARSGYKMHEL
ncbi:MAG: glycoside hydrolase family 99-like domain-containing protein [Deltaproteobacteria bacterium]|nr:glycoside hydrolase family 99-like domain-containing protein [Deltaproteobacteria bacterium]